MGFRFDLDSSPVCARYTSPNCRMGRFFAIGIGMGMMMFYFTFVFYKFPVLFSEVFVAFLLKRIGRSCYAVVRCDNIRSSSLPSLSPSLSVAVYELFCVFCYISS